MHRITIGKRRRLTGGGTDHDQPAFSPDGRLIAFAEGRFGEIDLFLVDRRGRFVRRLTDEDGDETQPCFSPDGTTIAYSHQPRPTVPSEGASGSRVPARWEIHVIGLEPGSRPCTLLADQVASFKQPAYAPDGRRIAYLSDEGSPGNFHLFLLDLETAERRQLTHERNRNDSRAAFSPEGRRIAFHAYEGLEADRGNIYLLDLLDGEVERVTDRPGISKHPSFADRRTVVFHREEPGEGPALFAVDLKNGREWRLSAPGAFEKQPNVVRTRGGKLRVVYTSRSAGGADDARAFDLYRAELFGCASS